MPNVYIPQEIDTGDSLRRQETMGGTSAQTRFERVLEQPNEPPLTEGYTSGSGEGRMEYTVELTDIVQPTPYDSPLTGGYTYGSNKGRLTLIELINICTTLSNRVTTLETKLSSTKAVHHKAFIAPTKRVKNEQGEVYDIAEPLKDDDDDATLAETLLNIKRSTAKDKGKCIMQETKLPQKIKKREMIQLSLDEELVQKLYAKELAKETARQEQEKYNLEKALELQRQLDKREEDVDKAFFKVEVRKNMCMYLKNQGWYKQSYFKGMKYVDIRPIFERVWDKIHTFVPKDSEIEKEVMKRSRFHLQQESSKKQKLDEQIKEGVEAQADTDQKVEKMKLCMKIVPDEEIVIDVIPLATKPLVIVE
nr:hypothetical protein [Tanacetum cinerariifolium]GEW76033.1 hypothetical protein [Tanacetum cinerariifolium]